MIDKAKMYHPEKKTAADIDNQEKSQTIAPTLHTGVDAETAKRQQQIDEKANALPKEYGGRSKDKGLEPTRYGDWELKGRCIDF